MLKFLGIVVIIVAALLIAFFITKINIFTKYGWPSKIPFYIVEFVTVDGKSNYFTVAYLIDGEYYRLKLRQFPTFEVAKANVDSIVNTVNRYTKKKNLIEASLHITEERLISVTDIKIVPNWVVKLMNFRLSICSSKQLK